jgi:hypothetical protein
VLPNSFSVIPRASGFVFMLCALGPIFGGTEGVRSSFHVLRSRNRFRHYRGQSIQFSCFAFPNSLSAEARASDPIFVLCAPEPVFGGIEGVKSSFHVLRSLTHFRWYRGFQVQFSCFVLSNLFSTVPLASCPILMFCAPGLIFDGTDGVGSSFNVLRSRTCF